MALDQLVEQLKANAIRSKQRRDENDSALMDMRMAAQQALQAQAQAPVGGSGGGVGSISPTIMGGGTAGNFGKIDPYAAERTMNFNGMSYTVNSTAAPRFQGFLKALSKSGYTPHSIGGYSNRNIAGTNTKSLHSYGLAIDIDPGKNPVTWNGVNKTALPKGVGKLAKKYGLVWGGNWNGSKKDTMHFSVPYFGTK